MIAAGISLEQVGNIVKQHERGFLTELEMETMILCAVFDRPFDTDDVMEIHKFIRENL